MMLSIRHSYVSPIPDTSEPDIVHPSHWNAAHSLTGLLSPSQIDLTANYDWAGVHTQPSIYGGNLGTSTLTIGDTTSGTVSSSAIYFRSGGGLSVTPALNQGAPGTSVWQALPTNMSISPNGKWFGLTGTPTAAYDATFNCLYPLTDPAQPTSSDSSFADCGSYTNTDHVITGITRANPAVVTSASHGFSNGDNVWIQDVVGMTQVNGAFYSVAGATTNTFQLSGVNSSAYTAYSSAGIVTRQQYSNMRIATAYVYGNALDINAFVGTTNAYQPNGGGSGIVGVGNCFHPGGVCYGSEIATNCYSTSSDCGNAVALQLETGGSAVGPFGATRAYLHMSPGAASNAAYYGIELMGGVFSPFQSSGSFLTITGPNVHMAYGIDWHGATIDICGYRGPAGLCITGADKITAIPGGSLASPSVRFGTDTASGFTQVSADTLDWVGSGVARVLFSNTNIAFTPLVTVGGNGIAFPGGTSGSVTVAAQSAAGTPIISWPTATGTVVTTAASPLSINSTTGQITCSTCLTNTPAALTKTDDTNVTLTLGGTPATAVLQATSLALGWTGVLSGARGGTGVNNGANTVTVGGNFSTTGAFAVGTATASSGNLLIGSGSAWVTQAMSGDVTIGSTGVTAIGASKVTNAMLQNSTMTIAGKSVALGGSYAPLRGSSTGSNATNATGTLKMAGLAGSFTPATSGKMMLIVQLAPYNDTSGDGCKVQIAYGTGAAPAAGDAATGTTAGIQQFMVSPGPFYGAPTTLVAYVSGLSVSTAYWLDVQFAVNGGGGTSGIASSVTPSLISIEL